MTLTTDEAAKTAGVSPVTIRKWVMLGWLEPQLRGARPMRFDYDDVARCQREHRPETWKREQERRAEQWHACFLDETER